MFTVNKKDFDVWGCTYMGKMDGKEKDGKLVYRIHLFMEYMQPHPPKTEGRDSKWHFDWEPFFNNIYAVYAKESMVHIVIFCSLAVWC